MGKGIVWAMRGAIRTTLKTILCAERVFMSRNEMYWVVAVKAADCRDSYIRTFPEDAQRGGGGHTDIPTVSKEHIGKA